MWTIASEPMPTPLPSSLPPSSLARRPGRGLSPAPSFNPATGFTLVELLVVAAAGVVVLAGAVVMVVSHIRSSSRMGALLHLQDHCGRVQFLINHEIQQAARATGGADQLVLQVPGLANPITYSLNDDAELRRDGPGIDAQGRLEAGASRNDLVARGVEAFVVDVSNPLAPSYRLTLRDATGMTYTTRQAAGSPDGGAHCRPREITGAAEG